MSLGPTVVKGNAKKVRRLPSNILVGFAGSTADAMTLLERLEKKLEEHPGQLMRACVELAKLWRSDKYLRRLEVSTVNTALATLLTMLFETDGVICCLHKATLLVADATNSFELTGNGDVLEPEGGVVAIGSGGSYALGTVDMQKAVVRYCVDNWLLLFMPLTMAIVLAAALALMDQPAVDAEAIVMKSMKIAGDICVYTNNNLVVEKIDIEARIM